MDFDLTEEQRLLKDSVERLLADVRLRQRKKYAKEPDGWSRAVWGKFAELGLLGLPFAEERRRLRRRPGRDHDRDGGVRPRAGARALSATVMLGGGFLRRAGAAEQKARICPASSTAARRFAFAQVETQSRYDLADVATTAKQDGDGWVLDGDKSVVLHGDSADTLVVTARTAGGSATATASACSWCRRTPGVSRGLSDAGRPCAPPRSRFPACEVGAEAVIGEPGERPAADRARRRRGHRRAVRRGGRRHGRALHDHGRVPQDAQAVRRADRLASRCCSTAPSTCWSRSSRRAAWRCSPPWRPSRRRQERANAIVGGQGADRPVGQFIGQEAIQLHGGIGMTMEAKVGHYFKRLTMIDRPSATPTIHLRSVATAGGLIWRALSTSLRGAHAVSEPGIRPHQQPRDSGFASCARAPE